MDMVAYSFQKQFVEPILDGTKRHTIRANRFGRSRHARPGEALQLYYGMRTKHCRKIADATCATVLPILIYRPSGLILGVNIDGVAVQDLEAFARSDGFESLAAMSQFWTAKHGHGSSHETIVTWHPLPTQEHING